MTTEREFRKAIEESSARLAEAAEKSGAAFGAGRYSDAARRMSDLISLAITAQGFGVFGKWMAFRLSDGGGDGVTYDRKADAVRHQLHEFLCCYVKVPPTGMTPRQCQNFLHFNRQLYDAGMRVSDPDRAVVMPMNPEHYRPGLIIPPTRRYRRD